MQAFAQLLVRRTTAWAIVLVVLLLSLASLFFASRVDRDDDVLSFLPRENPEVGVFYDVSKRFGSLDIALVGISTDDALSPEFLTRLRDLTKRLNETDGVGYAMTLTNMDDFVADPQKGGITNDYLVGKIPETPEERAALREKVLSLDHVVGNLISADGKAALLYCFAGHGADQKVLAQKVRAAVEEAFPREAKFWGGAPFISTYIYGVTQDDMRRLAPWAVLVIVLITVISFRDVIGAGLALLSTALGIVMSLGLMGALGVPVDVILGSLPVILFALGSAYAVHILSHYYTVAHEHDRETALVRTICEMGPPVLASGLMTVAGLLSFLLMDIAPLRTFGVFAAVGILITLALSLTFVPAVAYLVKLKGRPAAKGGVARLHEWLCTLPQRRRVLVGGALGALALGSALFVGKIESRMDNAAFFSKNSPPDQAETFLRDGFGGSLFVQIQVEGDMTDPVVLREIQALADRLVVLPHVNSVNHVGAVVAQINEAMEGDRRIPDTTAKVKLLYGFLEGKKAVTQLVTDDRKKALLQVKLDTSVASETEPVLEKIREVAGTAITTTYTVAEAKGARKDEVAARVRSLAAARMRAVGKAFGTPMPEQADLEARLAVPAKADASEATRAALTRFLGSEECSVELEGAETIDKVARALTALGSRPDEAKLAETIAVALDKPVGDTLVTDLADTVDRPLEEIWRRSEAMARAKQLALDAKIAAPAGLKGDRFYAAIAAAWMDLDVPALALPPVAGTEPSASGEQKLAVAVTGLPVMHAGLSRSVASNHWKSLFFALGFVLLLMVGLFRSFWSGLLGVLPIMLTMAVVYGGMGLLGVPLDIGTSMLPSLIIGAGVDYAVHLMVAWNAPEKSPLAEAATTAARRAGPAIWMSAWMVAAGFFVLTLGEARPLKNVGGLTAAAMVAAALATMLVIPLFARKTRYYGDGTRIPSAAPASDASDAVLDTSTSPSLNERGSR
ncbi:efflux RND transporter permease subunit [Polyangium mundeleinium]|uniref:MMPL family transporter n=1 Tax=Polyangium mundeleinium TaxID=2995306 RepID=A0ABT5F009_9BACT|nr:MMPL family transporter [Polyangium mundeleinium]MDC0747418.1 MMPL family transporter [Polyangium mundeleinium]